MLPDSPADNRCRGGEHTRVGYESSQVSCPFACQQEVMGNLPDGPVAALVEGLWLNRETAGPVAVPEGWEGLDVAIPNRVQNVNMKSRMLRTTVEGGHNHGKPPSPKLRQIHSTSLLAGGLALPCGVIKAAGRGELYSGGRWPPTP